MPASQSCCDEVVIIKPYCGLDYDRCISVNADNNMAQLKLYMYNYTSLCYVLWLQCLINFSGTVFG